MMSCMHNFTKELQAVDSRVEHVETKMGDFDTTINDLVDASEAKDKTDWVKAKLADIEDRSRRNNLKIRGIPESISQVDLRKYTTNRFKVLLPELTDMDVTIDRIYHLHKPNHLLDYIPRDLILRLHFFTKNVL